MDNSDLQRGLQAAHQAQSVTLLFFARLREALGSEREQIALPEGVRDVAALREHLRARGGAWAAELAAARPVRVAVNQDMATASTPISAGDEIAFFPPVTGG
jgi:molybdopterin synthase sulfur carrier subunit